MANCYRVQIGVYHLTSTGVIPGVPCYLEVVGWDDLLTPVTGNVRLNADGSPDIQTYEWTAGKQFDVKPAVLFKELWDELCELQKDSLQNGTEFTVSGTGDFGDFSVTAKAFPEKPFTAASFHNGIINGAVFRFITV